MLSHRQIAGQDKEETNSGLSLLAWHSYSYKHISTQVSRECCVNVGMDWSMRGKSCVLLSLYGRIRVNERPYSRIFYAVGFTYIWYCKGLKGSSYTDFNGGYILHRGGYILHPTDVVNINCVSARFSPVKYIWSWGNIRKGMKVQFGKY